MSANRIPELSDYFYDSASAEAMGRRARARTIGAAVRQIAIRLRAWSGALAERANGRRHHTPSLG